MNRRPRFLVLIASAVITFGTLMATIGPRHFHRPFGHNRHEMEACFQQHSNCEDRRKEKNMDESKPVTTSKTTTNPSTDSIAQ